MPINHNCDFPMSQTFADFVDERPVPCAHRECAGADHKSNLEEHKKKLESQATQIVVLEILNQILVEVRKLQADHPKTKNSDSQILPGHKKIVSIGLTESDLNGS